jgi:YVTN family beta-propeller protein
MNRRGTKLCAAGTMSDYAAIVNRKTARRTIRHIGPKPYWSTNSPVRNECWLSVSGADRVVVLDYRTARRVATIPVGDHPQRVREGFVDTGVLARWRS